MVTVGEGGRLVLEFALKMPMQFLRLLGELQVEHVLGLLVDLVSSVS